MDDSLFSVIPFQLLFVSLDWKTSFPHLSKINISNEFIPVIYGMNKSLILSPFGLKVLGI